MTFFAPTPLDQGRTYYKRLYAKRGFGRQKRKGKEEEERGGEGSKNPALKKIGVPTSNSFVKPRSELYDPSLSPFFWRDKAPYFLNFSLCPCCFFGNIFGFFFFGVIIIIFGCQVRRGRRGVHMGFWDGLGREGEGERLLRKKEEDSSFLLLFLASATVLLMPA